MFIFFSSSRDSEFTELLESRSQTPIAKTPQKLSKPGDGEIMYVKHCLSCHQKDGSGVPNMFPPIQKSDWVNGDKDKLINVLLNGLEGDIDVNGDQYSQAMPKQNYLTDLQIAGILTYIRQNFGNNASAILPSDVAKLRSKEKKK